MNDELCVFSLGREKKLQRSTSISEKKFSKEVTVERKATKVVFRLGKI